MSNWPVGALSFALDMMIRLVDKAISDRVDYRSFGELCKPEKPCHWPTSLSTMYVHQENPMNAKELVRRWKERQAQILAQLPEEIRAEFHELTVAIRRAESELSGKRHTAPENGRAP